MRHARNAALDQLEPLLKRLRAFSELREKSRGAFYLRSRSFLHFHEDPAGLFADSRTAPGGGFERIKGGDPPGDADLMRRVGAYLAAAASEAARLS